MEGLVFYPSSQPIEVDVVASISGVSSGERSKGFKFNTHYAKLPFWELLVQHANHGPERRSRL